MARRLPVTDKYTGAAVVVEALEAHPNINRFLGDGDRSPPTTCAATTAGVSTGCDDTAGASAGALAKPSRTTTATSVRSP